MPTQSPARAFDALQVPFPVTNASRHAQPSFASPHAACPAPSLANYSPPAPTADTHGWMGPPTSLPASRAKIINKKFDRLLDKSPVPRSIARAYDNFQSSQLRHQSKKRTLSGFTAGDGARMDGKEAAKTTMHKLSENMSVQTATKPSLPGNITQAAISRVSVVDGKEDQPNLDNVADTEPKGSMPEDTNGKPVLVQFQRSLGPATLRDVVDAEIPSPPASPRDYLRATITSRDGKARRGRDGGTNEQSCKTIGGIKGKTLRKRKRSKSPSGAVDAPPKIVARRESRPKVSATNAIIAQEKPYRPKPAETVANPKTRTPKQQAAKRLASRIQTRAATEARENKATTKTEMFASANIAKNTRRASDARALNTVTVPPAPVPSAAISKQLGLDIPASILAATGSSWDPLSGRRHSRRNTVYGTTETPRAAISKTKSSNVQPSSAPSKTTAAAPKRLFPAPSNKTHVQVEVPDSELRRSNRTLAVSRITSKKGRESTVSKSVPNPKLALAMTEVGETPVKSITKIASKLSTFARRDLSSRAGVLEKEKGKERNSINKTQSKGKESSEGQKPIAVATAEKDPYAWSDEE